MGMSFISLDNYLIKLENDIQRDVETCCQINNFIKPIFHRILLVNFKISTQQNFLQFFYSDFFIFCIRATMKLIMPKSYKPSCLPWVQNFLKVAQ